MIDHNTTAERLKQQIIDLANRACGGDESAGDAITEFCRCCLRDHARQMGTRKGRENNLKRALRASVSDLQDKGKPLTFDAIVANLWVINHGLNDLQLIIQDIEPGHSRSDSFVYWVDQRGIERKNNFNDIHGYLNRMELIP